MSQFLSPKFYIIVLGFITIQTACADDTRLPTIQLTAKVNQENSLESKSLTGFKHDILEVPFNKSHVSQEVIEKQNIQRVSDALSQVSGVFYQDSYGGGFWDNYSFRGFSTDPNMGTNSLRNGLSTISGIHTPQDMVNVESIDFLKGPVAAIYGQSAIGGMMNITTKKPSWTSSHTLSLSTSTDQQYRTSLDFTDSINDRLAYRLGLAYENNQSFRNDVTQKHYFIAPQMTWKISDHTQLFLDTEFAKYSGLFDRGIPLINGKFADIRNFYGDPRDGNMQVKSNFYQLRLNHQITPDWESSTALSYNDGERFGTSTEISSVATDLQTLNRFRRYRYFSTNTLLLQSVLKGHINDTFGLKHEVLVNAEIGTYKIHQLQKRNLAGTNSSINFYTPTNNSTPLTLGRTTKYSDEKQNTLGINLQDQVFFNDQWSLLLGARLDQMQQRIIDRKNQIQAKKTYTPFSPRLGLNYQVNQHLAFYSNWGKAFEMNTGLNKNHSLYSPEQTRSWELGGKYSFNPMSLLSLTYFDMTKKHLLTEGITDSYVDTGKAQSRGIEASLLHHFNDHFNISTNYTFTNASILESEVEAKGARLKNIPKHSANFTANYNFNIKQYPIDASLSANYYGTRSANYIDNGTSLPAFTTINLGVGMQINPDLKARLNITNLLNKTYYVSSYTNYWVQPGEPLKATLSFDWNF